jgi:hypothetical protein
MKKILFILMTAMIACVSCKKESAEQVIERRVKDMGGATAQLGTVEYTISKIIEADHEGAFYKIGERKILFSTRSTMKAGVDLKNFCADSVIIDKNTITINLPKPQIVAFNMPAENIKMEYSKTSALRSDFSVDERNELLKQGEQAIIDAAEDLGVFAEAEKNVRTLFETMLSRNYEKVNINFN